MKFFNKIADLFRKAFKRKKREEEWASRFTNPPASRDGKLPLDPRNPGGLA